VESEEISSFGLCLLSRSQKAVTAECAFLHHALCPEGNVAIERALHLLGPFGWVPVEVLDGVRTSRGTVAAADAPVIDLGHQPSSLMYVANTGQTFVHGRLITVHARNRKKVHLYMRIGSLHFGDEIHPEFCSSQLGILFSHNGNIILLPTGYYTGLTTCTFV
jgi:hypothetical protein